MPDAHTFNEYQIPVLKQKIEQSHREIDELRDLAKRYKGTDNYEKIVEDLSGRINELNDLKIRLAVIEKKTEVEQEGKTKAPEPIESEPYDREDYTMPVLNKLIGEADREISILEELFRKYKGVDERKEGLVMDKLRRQITSLNELKFKRSELKRDLDLYGEGKPELIEEPPPGGFKCSTPGHEDRPATTKLLHRGLLGNVAPFNFCEECEKLLKITPIDDYKRFVEEYKTSQTENPIVKKAGVEIASNGVGVTTGPRIYARKFYAAQGNEEWGRARNAEVNELLAKMFETGTWQKNFRLRSGETAEIRQSGPFFLVGVERRGSHDIIVIQDSFKQGPR